MWKKKKCVFSSIVHLSIGLFAFLFKFLSFVYILDINAL
jgi:hypothetical protein